MTVTQIIPSLNLTSSFLPIHRLLQSFIPLPDVPLPQFLVITLLCRVFSSRHSLLNITGTNLGIFFHQNGIVMRALLLRTLVFSTCVRNLFHHLLHLWLLQCHNPLHLNVPQYLPHVWLPTHPLTCSSPYHPLLLPRHGHLLHPPHRRI